MLYRMQIGRAATCNDVLVGSPGPSCDSREAAFRDVVDTGAIDRIHIMMESPSNIIMATSLMMCMIEPRWRSEEYDFDRLMGRGTRMAVRVIGGMGFRTAQTHEALAVARTKAERFFREAESRQESDVRKDAPVRGDLLVIEDWLARMGPVCRVGDTEVTYTDECESVLLYLDAMAQLIPPLREV